MKWLIVVMLIVSVESLASAEECESVVWSASQTLQPWYKTGPLTTLATRAQHLKTLTAAICKASNETGINPLIALAVARRESSLLPMVGLGEKNGARGERGYFQILPRGPAEQFAPDHCDQYDPLCNAMTAMRYMVHVQTVCNTHDPWVWIGAYGTSKCPSSRDAREWMGLKAARHFLCEVDDNCDETWPR